jgi:hypothetical protein
MNGTRTIRGLLPYLGFRRHFASHGYRHPQRGSHSLQGVNTTSPEWQLSNEAKATGQEED